MLIRLLKMNNNKVMIIAEAGVNHNGSIKKDENLIEIASESGADYIKFQTKDRGLYRIAASELTAVGVNLTQVNGANFQLFYRGEEVPIYVTTPGPFTTNDYIEFFADKHDGEFDTQLFKNSN